MKTIRCAGVEAIAVILLAGWMAGCGQGKSEKTESPAVAPPSKVAKAEVPVGDADLLQNVAVGAVVTNKAMAEGDRAWKQVLDSVRPPSPPAEWDTKPPSDEAVAEFEKKIGVLAAEAAGRMKDFYTKYPKHEMAGEAHEREQYLLSVALQRGNTNVLARLNELEEAKLKDPNLSEDDRLQLRVGQLQRLMGGAEGDVTSTLTQLEKGARALMKEFPKRPELAGLLVSVAQNWLENNHPDKARALAKELVEAKASEEIEAAAQSLLKKLDRIGKPLAIKFKSIDGREVDLQAMNGKVVLVDFWATWCGPCMAELPKVKAAYEKLKPKGFEILGISLDREQDALEKVVSREKMTWPQCYDGGNNKPLAEEFEIASIPTMWLVDKKGNLRDMNAREKLTEKVEKLLAE